MATVVCSASRCLTWVVFAGFFIAFASVCAGSARAAEYVPSAAERRAQINRVIDALNSPDPTTRIITLEEATASKDANLRRIALSTAFASADPDLRGAALTAAVRLAPVFVVDIASGPAGEVRQGTGASFEVRINKFDRGTNTFRTSSRYSRNPNASYAGTPVNEGASQGAVTGDRISFSVDLFQINYQCSGVARLQGGTTSLKGTMSCTIVSGYFKTESYDIKIDVPK